MPTLAAGCGLRQGEVFGPAVDDVDVLRGVVHVRRQVKLLGGRQVFAPPKGRKLRDVPLPKSVDLELAAHLHAWPAVSVDLPWEDVSDAPRSAELLLSTREKTALQRKHVNARGVEARADGGRSRADPRERHARPAAPLRQRPARRGGVGPRPRRVLGHADPGFTLRVYTHLMPASEERTRRAVDHALRGVGLVDGSTRCARNVHGEAL